MFLASYSLDDGPFIKSALIRMIGRKCAVDAKHFVIYYYYLYYLYLKI